MVRIKATDANGLVAQRDISVQVDGPPTLTTTHSFPVQYDAKAVAATGEGTLTITGLEDYFTDKETASDDLMYSVASSNQGVVEVPADGTLSDSSDLTLTVHQGTATVTITVTDGRMQTVKASFKVVVEQL